MQAWRPSVDDIYHYAESPLVWYPSHQQPADKDNSVQGEDPFPPPSHAKPSYLSNLAWSHVVVSKLTFLGCHRATVFNQ